jgi:branched-chain amino acid transport system substrate-binding protein
LSSSKPSLEGRPRLKAIIASIVALCALSFVVAACGGDDSSGDSSGSFKVGVLAPMSGSVASDGEDMKNASEMAIASVNADGGIDGRKVELNVADDACEAQQGVQAAEKLAQDKVVAVVGGFCSDATLPAMEVFQRDDNLPFVVSVSSNPDVTENGFENIVRIIGRDDAEAPANVAYLNDVIKSEKVAIVHDNTEFAVSVADNMKKEIEDNGGPEIVYFDAVQPGSNDYRAMLDRVEREGADTLFYTGFYPEYGPIARQWKSTNKDYNLVGGTSTINATVAELAPEAAADDKFSIVIYPTALLLQGPEAKQYRADYKKKFGNEPGPYGVFQYDAMKTLLAAIEEDPSDVSHEALNERLKGMQIEGVTGAIEFDEKGDRTAFPYLAVRSDGTDFVPVQTINDEGSWSAAEN